MCWTIDGGVHALATDIAEFLRLGCSECIMGRSRRSGVVHLECRQWVGCQRVGLAIVSVAAVISRGWAGGSLLVRRDAAAMMEEVVKLVLLVSLVWLGLFLWFTEGSIGTALGHHEECSDDADGSDKDPDEQDASADDGFLTNRPVQSVGNV